MDATRLNDRVAKGMGRAALRIGERYDAFRPAAIAKPLARRHFVLSINVAFHGEDRDWHRSARYGQPVWFAILDTAYTRPGDYLVGPLGTFFVASQPPMLPTVCVQTNRILRFARPGGARNLGLNGYGGVQAADNDMLLDGWPASVLAAGSGHGAGELPGETPPPGWTVLLPALRGKLATELRPGDLMTDEEGSGGVIAGAELTALGWRLNVTQAPL